MIRWLRKRRQSRLEKQVKNLESQLEAKDRTIAVQQAEIDSMAAVIARDRQRIKAEGAAYAQKRALAEGVTDERPADQGNGRFGPELSVR